MIRFRLAFLIFLYLPGMLQAQSVINPCVKSTEGKDFWFGFMESRNNQSGHYLELTMTSIFTCHFSVYYGKSTTPALSYTLNPNIPFRYQPPWTLVEPIGSETIESKGIHIVSDMPMNIFAMNWSPSSADAAVIFPIEAIGNEYYAMCYEPNINENSNGTPGNGKNSEFVVVASEDNTKVTITPTKITDKLKPVNIPFTITLNKGELYQVQSMNHANLVGQGDLTGSYIKSDKPVAFFSGSWSTTIPIGATSAYDHLYEQIPPVRTWGRKFVTVPFSGRAVDVFRILASVDKTTIRIGSNTSILLNKGKFYEFQLTKDQPSLIESDQPILLAQFMVSNIVDKPANVNSWDGDPLMLIVSPVDQTRETVTFVAYDSPNINSKYFVNVVAKNDAIAYILLDNQTIKFSYLPNTEYAYAQVPITKGNHNLTSTKSGMGFIAYVYGYGGVESYGYGVGFNLSIKLDLGGDIQFVSDTISLCQGQAKILNAGSHFSKFLWSTGDTTQTLGVTKQGYSKVTATTSDGCQLTDSIYTYVSNPVIDLGNDKTICKPNVFQLDAGPGYISYLWNTKDSTQKITTITPDKYRVTAINKYLCPATDSVFINFVDKPKLNLSALDTLICGSKTTTVKITADKGSYTLTSPNTTVKITNLTATVPYFGTYNFKYTAIDPYFCATDTTFKLGFHEFPIVNFGNDTTICKPNTFLLDAGPGNLSYLWNTKDSTQKITTKTPGNYRVTAINKYLCSASDSILVNFDNKPKLNASALDTLICGSKTATLKITADKGSYTLTSPNSAVKFKDLTATVPIFGTYNFKVTAIDPYFCATDTTFKLGFHELPVVNLGNDTTICRPLVFQLDAGAGNLSYLWNTKDSTQKITTKTPGNYRVTAINKYLCPASDSIFVNFDDKPRLNLAALDTLICGSKTATLKITADKGSYTLTSPNSSVSVKDLTATVQAFGSYNFKYTAIDPYFCSTDTTFKLGFHKKPTVSISVNDTTCYGYSLKASALGDATIPLSRYTWIFGGDTISNKVGRDTEQIPLGVNQKKRDLVLNVTEDGCTGTNSLKDILVIPDLKLDVKKSLQCQLVPFDFWAENTENVTIYEWNFGDGTSGIGKTLSHSYAKDGYYDVKLTVTTDKGCTNTANIKKMVYVAPIPTVMFSIPFGVCLNPGKDTLSYTGSANNMDTYYWDLNGLDSQEIIQSPDTTAGPLVFNLLNKPKTILSLYVISQYGCRSTTESLEVKRRPVFTFSPAFKDGCTPLEVKFNALAGDPVDQLNYRWDFGDGNNGTGASINNTYYVPNRDYDLKLNASSSLTGCSDSIFKPKSIVVYPIPEVAFSLPAGVCLNPGSDTLKYVGTSNIKDTFHWDLNGLDSPEIIQSPDTTSGPLIFNLLNKPKTILSLYVISQYGCRSSTESLEVKRRPLFTWSSSVMDGCIPLEVKFKAQAGDPVDQLNYRWNFGDGNSLPGASITHTYPVPDTTYDITLFASSLTTGCKDTLFKPKYITVFPQPKASFSIAQKILTNDNPVATFTNQSIDAEHYLWKFGDGLISTLKDPEHKYEVVGPRRVVLESENQFGCKDTTSDVVMIELSRIYPPNAFSPSAPTVIDREFFPYSNGVLEKGYHLKIISRWNEVIFEAKDVLKGWNGLLSDGSHAPTGTYVWILNFVDFLGKAHRMEPLPLSIRLVR